MNTRLVGIVAASIVWAGVARAENQVWNDGGPNNNWSTNEANWGAGAVWTNGNSAIFSGNGGVSTGEVVDIAATVTVANVTFQTNGYVIADANKDGSLSVAGSPSVFTVVNASDTGTMSVSIGGSGGITKAGNGVLSLTTNSAYAGTTTVSAGVLRLARNQPNALGQVGGGNDTVVASGATLDFNGAYVSSSPQEKFTISGSGTDGKGVLINNGAGHVNVGIGAVTMLDDAVIGGSSRIDAYTIYANGHTLTKTGSGQLCVQNVATGTIVISSGQYTLLADNRGLGGTTPGDTYVYGTANLDSWNTMTVNERVFFNGGYVTQGNPNNQLFTLAGYMTLNSNVTFNTGSPTSGVEVAGYMDGNGGFTQAGNGWCYITGNTNTFSGPTIINSGKPLWIGKTVGGTGRLGSGAVTNYGTLYANSAVLGSGEVVNNAGGVLYLSPANLNAGRIVNTGAGTVYGTSIVQTVSSVVNSGTWQCYSGSFGSSIVTNASGGTLNLYTNVLTYGQFVNSGTLNILNPMTFTGAMTVNGGTVNFSAMSNTLVLAGPLTLSSNFSLNSVQTSVVELSGKISGPGGLTRSGDGLCFVTGDSNDYTGPTTVNAGKSLWVGKPAGEAAGRLGSGAITNNGALYFDSAGAYTNFNGINGYGVTAIRYGGQVIVSGGVSSNSDFHVANGSLTLTNGAIFSAYSQLTIANRADVKYVVAPTNCLLPTNVFATVTVNNGCALIVKSVTFGNGNDLPGGTMTGILNQVGGVVRTTGAAAEDNGVRLGHYPQARSFYKMMGGTLFVEGNWDLGCATDGEGWFNMTGGEVFTKRVMLNERDYDGGFGRLTVAGGTLNVGSLTGSSMAISNSITADLYARYLVEFGGAGGVVRAVTNLWIPASATLIGTGTNAITFDSQAWTITMTNKLSGTGGLNKAGSGTLVLSGNNTYSGGTAVKEGTLVPAGRFALPNGALTFGVAANGTCGVLHMTNDLSLTGLSVGVVNPEQLDKNQSYTVITYSGALSGSLGSASLPKPWYVYYDWSGNTVQLRAGAGTKIWLK